MEYQDNLRGALFKNKNMREGKKDPDYSGVAEIDGNRYYMDAWINVSKNQEKYLGVRFKLKDVAAIAKAATPQPTEPDEFLNDDIPF